MLEPLVAAQCEWLFSCCAMGEVDWLLGPFTTSVEDCIGRTLESVEGGFNPQPAQGTSASKLLFLAWGLDLERIVIDQSGVDACLEELSSRECEMWEEPGPCTPGGAPPVDPCDPTLMFIGTQQVDMECHTSQPWECAAGLRCVNFGGGFGLCAEEGQEGETCFFDAECGDGLACDWTTGTCGLGAGDGEPCAYTDPENPVLGTESVRCESGLSCDPASNTCVGSCAPGAACIVDSQCPEDLQCVLDYCRVPGGDGEPCEVGSDCDSLICDPLTDTCQPLLPSGDPCVSSWECESGWCDTATFTCAGAAAAGDPCPSFNADECASGWCDTTDPLAPVCASWVNEGGACTSSAQCDPDADPVLSCADLSCQVVPFANGTSCTSGAACESGVCFELVCADGGTQGDSCDGGIMFANCAIDHYCDIVDMTTMGECEPRKASGEPCLDNIECWGQCEVIWGQQMCDSTSASLLEEVWCDGP